MILKVAMQNKFQFRMHTDMRGMFFRPKGELHYIGGVDILPSPLNAEEEREVFWHWMEKKKLPMLQKHVWWSIIFDWLYISPNVLTIQELM